jgi:quinoprotein glucose dehydrogenase
MMTPSRPGTPPRSSPPAKPASAGPPVVLGVLLVVLGGLLVLGGLWLISRGSSPYFAVVGVGLTVSGVLLARGKKIAIVAYALTFAVILVWSFIETKGSMQQLIPRVAVPLFVALYLAQAKVRATLS